MNKKEAYEMMADVFKGKHFNNHVVTVEASRNMWGGVEGWVFLFVFFLPKYMDFFLIRPNSACSTQREI